MRDCVKRILALYLVLVMCIPVFSGMNASGEKANKEVTTVMELPNLENWHYKIPITVDTGDYNRTDCVLSQTINITWEIGGFGTFDPNSIRIIETIENGTPQYEAVSQYRWVNNDVLDIAWNMNGTTPANTQRYYSIYFDILENGAKNSTTYTEYVTTKENSQHLWVYGTDYEIKIDKDRGGSRLLKINDVLRKGYTLDKDWVSWHTQHINWGIKGASTTLIENGPIYKTVKIVSSDNAQTVYWYFYPDKMKIVTQEEYSDMCFDTIADNLNNKKGTLIWSDETTEDFTKDYAEYSKNTDFFYILDPELDSANDDVKGRSGFWADTIDGGNQRVINAGEKGTRWTLNGNSAWFGFAKNDVIRDVVLGSQNPPIITREYSWVVLESPTIEDEKVFENQVVVIKGDLTVTNTGTLVSIDSSLIIHGNITVEEGGEFYIVSSRDLLPPKPPELPPWPPWPPRPPRPPIRPPIRSVAVAGNISVNGKLFIAKDSLNICSETDGTNGIYITLSSTFECYNTTITAFAGEIPVGITNQKLCYEKSYYKFDIYGEAQIDGSKVSYLYDGIRILNGSDAVIQNCEIFDSKGDGIYIEGNAKPVISNNVVKYCSNAGIFINSTSSKDDENISVKKIYTNDNTDPAKAEDIWDVKTEMNELPNEDGWVLNTNLVGTHTFEIEHYPYEVYPRLVIKICICDKETNENIGGYVRIHYRDLPDGPIKSIDGTIPAGWMLWVLFIGREEVEILKIFAEQNPYRTYEENVSYNIAKSRIGWLDIFLKYDEGKGAVIENGILKLDTTNTNVYWYYTIDDWVGDYAEGWAVETKVKIVSASDNGIAIITEGGGFGTQLFLRECEVQLGNTSIDFITTDEFHVYRMVVQENMSELYIDGVLKITADVLVSQQNRICFGDIYEDAGCEGKSEWDYVYYYSKEPLTAKVDTYQKIGEVNKNVEFYGEGIVSDGNITLYEWDFDNDGTFDWNNTTIASTNYTYTTPGVYFPVLRVTDDKGATDIDYLRVNIWDPTGLTLYKNKVISSGSGIRLEGRNGNIINCMVYNCEYGVYCADSSPTIKDSCIFWNKNYDIYISQNSEPIMINASYNRTRVYLGDTANIDEDNWTDYQELYVYGFNPYMNDTDKENNNADFDGDGFTNVEEGNVYGTDPLNPDTDGNGIKDGDEVDGKVTRYAVDMGDKGYLFYKDEPPSYDKTFTYHTDPLNPDTDLDGQNDYNDLIPLDYDMDGDRKINHPCIVDPPSPYYVERLVSPVNADPNLERDANGNLVPDEDMDDDEREITQGYDDDKDADGMDDGYECFHGIEYGGWQNEFVHNARYAMIIIGGGTKAADSGSKTDSNYPAFWNDGIELYKKLVNGYNYIEEDVYLLHSYWGRDTDHTTDVRVDSPATLNDIKNTFLTLKYKMTLNDFFFCGIVCHSDGPYSFGNARGESCWYGHDPTGANPLYNLSEGLDKLTPALMCIVIQVCYAGGALDDLYGSNRIILTSSTDTQLSYVEWTHLWETPWEHWAFLYEGKNPWGTYNGFIKTMGSLSSPKSVQDMFNAGSNAAQQNQPSSTAMISDMSASGADKCYL